jgi:hypothetical protein
MTPPFLRTKLYPFFGWFRIRFVYNFILCFVLSFVFLFDIQMLQLFIRAHKFMITRSRRASNQPSLQDYYHCGQVPAVLYKRIILSLTFASLVLL